MSQKELNELNRIHKHPINSSTLALDYLNKVNTYLNKVDATKLEEYKKMICVISRYYSIILGLLHGDECELENYYGDEYDYKDLSEETLKLVNEFIMLLISKQILYSEYEILFSTLQLKYEKINYNSVYYSKFAELSITYDDEYKRMFQN